MYQLALVHASYKSTLFVGLAVLLTCSGTQDIRDSVTSLTGCISTVPILIVIAYSASIFSTPYAYSKGVLKMPTRALDSALRELNLLALVVLSA